MFFKIKKYSKFGSSKTGLAYFLTNFKYIKKNICMRQFIILKSVLSERKKNVHSKDVLEM